MVRRKSCTGAVAVLSEAGQVEMGVMRRGAKNEAQTCANDWGQDTTRDSFWLLKLKEGAPYDSSTADDSAEWTPSRTRVDVQSGVLVRLISTSCDVTSGRLALTRWPSPKRRSTA